MKTEKSVLKETKFPAPLNGYIVIANPIIGIEEELKEELKKLPDDKKRDYLRSKLGACFDAVEVLAVGPAVTKYKTGDVLATSMELTDRAVGLSTAEVLYLTEGSFFGKW